jgi:hypothetical protein
MVLGGDSSSLVKLPSPPLPLPLPCVLLWMHQQINQHEVRVVASRRNSVLGGSGSVATTNGFLWPRDHRVFNWRESRVRSTISSWLLGHLLCRWGESPFCVSQGEWQRNSHPSFPHRVPVECQMDQ